MKIGRPRTCGNSRWLFGEGWLDIAKKNNLVAALSADLMESVGFGKFMRKSGVRGQLKLAAEQNLATVALAAMGNIPCSQLCGV